MMVRTVEQVRRLVGLLGDTAEVPLFVFDAGYDPIAISHDLAGLRCETLRPSRRITTGFEISRCWRGGLSRSQVD